MSLAEDIVSVAFAAIAGAVSLTEADKVKARAAVEAKLAEVAAIDPGPLKPRADAVRARHLAAALIDTDRPGPLTDDEIEHELHVDRLRGMEARGALQILERESVRYALSVLDPVRR